jgi:hypothetical protein
MVTSKEFIMKEAIRLIRTQGRWICVVAIVAALCFGIAACSEDEDDLDTFAGTWIAPEGEDNVEMKIVAKDGKWTMYQEDEAMMRGTYKASGNTVDITITDGFMEGEWTAYSELPDEMKGDTPQNMTGTINGKEFTANDTIFTKQ